MLFLVLCGAAYGEESEEQLRDSAKNTVLEIVKKITQDRNAMRYFDSIDQKSIKLSSDSAVSREKGWMWSWEFSNDVKFVENPEKGDALGMLPVIESEKGILFKIFMAYGQGDSLVSRQKNHIISEKPRLVIGYWVKTKTDDAEFRKILDEIIVNAAASKGP
jgi:hypothetical protein